MPLQTIVFCPRAFDLSYLARIRSSLGSPPVIQPDGIIFFAQAPRFDSLPEFSTSILPLPPGQIIHRMHLRFKASSLEPLSPRAASKSNQRYLECLAASTPLAAFSQLAIKRLFVAIRF